MVSFCGFSHRTIVVGRVVVVVVVSVVVVVVVVGGANCIFASRGVRIVRGSN